MVNRLNIFQNIYGKLDLRISFLTKGNVNLICLLIVIPIKAQEKYEDSFKFQVRNSTHVLFDYPCPSNNLSKNTIKRILLRTRGTILLDKQKSKIINLLRKYFMINSWVL